MELVVKKSLVVLLERGFGNTLQYPRYNTNLKKHNKLLYEKSENHSIRKVIENPNNNVVEIFMEDIADFSGDSELEPIPRKWEKDDQWSGLNTGIIKNEDANVFQNTGEHQFSSELQNISFNESIKYEQFECDDGQLGQLPDRVLTHSGISIDKLKNNKYGAELEDPSPAQTLHVLQQSNDIEDSKLIRLEKSILRKAMSFICNICKIALKTKEEKREHRESHNSRSVTFEKIYQCPKCSSKAQRVEYFKLHYQKHAGKKIFSRLLSKCPECPYLGPDKRVISKHFLFHKRKGAFPCAYCTFSANHKKDLSNHLKIHNKFAEIYNCKQCPYLGANAAALNKHINSHHLPNEEKKWVFCPHCPFKIAEGSASLYVHLRRHKSTNGYRCPQCTYTSVQIFRVKKHLRVHYNRKEDIPEYNPPQLEKPIKTCPYCPYKTTFQGKLNRHFTIHHGTEERKQCADCPFTCKDKADMALHVKWHKERGTLQCQSCSFSHNSASLMTRHKRLHPDDRQTHRKKLMCPVCREVFPFPSQVKRHMSKHQTVDECAGLGYCANCPHKSKNKDKSFIGHVQGHLKKDGIKCDYCSFRHELKRCVTQHMMVHPEHV